MHTNRRLKPDARKAMLADLAKVHEHGERREYGEAKALALKVKAGLAWAGVRSAHIEWLLITEAMTLDPLEPSVLKSFDIIANRLRGMLLDPNRDPADDSTPRLHAMLVEAGKADELVHLAMARHLAEVGKDGEAMKLVEAVLLLSPTCRDAWLVKAMLAKKLGLADEAVAAEAEALACDGEPVRLFGIAGKAVA